MLTHCEAFIRSKKNLSPTQLTARGYRLMGSVMDSGLKGFCSSPGLAVFGKTPSSLKTILHEAISLL